MNVPAWAWALTVAVLLVMLAVDYLGHVRHAHSPTLRESAWWSAGYVAVAVVFGAIVWAVWGARYGGEYFAGYVTEKSL
ncbi:MAG: TerC family protein, partial [Actinobacteria bacterium]|nr:TerC family protein [Actinomycetota bacterium]